MEKKDTRKHNQQTQYELTKQVVRLRRRGFTNREVAGIVVFSETHTSTLWQKYIRGDIKQGSSDMVAACWSNRHAEEYTS